MNYLVLEWADLHQDLWTDLIHWWMKAALNDLLEWLLERFPFLPENTSDITRSGCALKQQLSILPRGAFCRLFPLRS